MRDIFNRFFLQFDIWRRPSNPIGEDPFYLLQETGDNILQETTDRILL